MSKTIIVKWKCIKPVKVMTQVDGTPVKTLRPLQKIITCSQNAIYAKQKGWLCDCGSWTTGNDDYHIPIRKGKREIQDLYKLRENVDITQILIPQIPHGKKFLPDPRVCTTCPHHDCPGPVRFEKDYFDRGYIDTNLPFCLHAKDRGINE